MDRRSSDDPAWTEWLSAHGARLFLYARQQTRTRADAEDVLQDALVDVLARLSAGALPPVPLVYATVRRRAIDRARSDARRRRRESADGAVTAPDGAWFDTTVEDADRARAVEAALRALPDVYREVVVLKMWSELTFAEIGEVTGVPLNTAASRYRYAMERLRPLLRDFHP